jgi:RNA polymerase sigma factor (sigma-70 family)
LWFWPFCLNKAKGGREVSRGEGKLIGKTENVKLLPVSGLWYFGVMVFDDSAISLALIKKAQRGCGESLSALTEGVKGDLTAYLLRLTLDPHLSEDLCQETMLEIVKHLGRLDIASTRAFWGWLYKCALSKVCHHLRKKKRVLIRHDLLAGTPVDAEQGPAEKLMRKELTLTIYEAISSLKIGYRNVIVLRCFEQMSYGEIAGITGGTQMQAKLQFFRAKKALERHLRKRKFKESHLLPALGLFAALTDKSVEAGHVAASLNAAALEVGAGTVVLGAAASKFGLVAAALICLVGATVSLRSRRDSSFAMPAGQPDGPLTHIMKDPSYVYPTAIVEAYDPDANGWASVVSRPQADIRRSTTVEDVLIYDRSLPGRSLLLPEGHCVQVRFPVSITDGPDVDLFLTGYGLTQKPQVTLVGPRNERLDLTPAASKDNPSGFTIVGYDLSDIALTFVPYDVCITGAAGADLPPFALRMVRASAGSLEPTPRSVPGS